MASEKGSITADAPLLSPAVHQPPSVGAPDLVANDPTTVKSLKRARETTPTPPGSTAVPGDISPSKIARLVNYARQPQIPPPLTGAAALEDERRRREEEQHHQRLHPPGSSENPTQKVLSELMSGANAAMSRVQDGLIDVGSSAAETAVKALQPVSIPNHTADGVTTSTEMNRTSPQSAMSAMSAGSAGEQRVVDSPSAMDVDTRNDRQYAPQQPEAQMDDRGAVQATSLSYPGILPPSSAMPAPAIPPRGMSLPMAASPNPERSPSLKKHKCPYCETEFTRHHNLKSHLLTHSQEKPYHCSECNMRFRRLHDLKRHTKLHTGEKPHICPKCNRKFARADALARHSKGAGGCAGRRSSMGSFGVDDEYDGMGDGDDSAMTGVVYDGTAEADLTEEERRRLSLPSIKAQHVPGHPGHPGQPGQPGQSGQGGIEGYRPLSSRTYPPAGPQPTPSGGLFPPNVDRGIASTTTSPGMPNSTVSGHTPNTSISSMPMSAGSSSLFSQSAMTESPKPLSPGSTQAHPTGHDKTQRSSSLAQQLGSRQEDANAPSGLSVPPHGTSDAAQSAWLSQYPPADASNLKGPSHTVASGLSTAATSQGAAGQTRAPGAPLGADNTNNMFASGEQGLWSYIHTLEEKVKSMGEELAAVKKTEAELLDKVGDFAKNNANLSDEVAHLRQQLGIPADSVPAQS
jgi:hypothetical protein